VCFFARQSQLEPLLATAPTSAEDRALWTALLGLLRRPLALHAPGKVRPPPAATGRAARPWEGAHPPPPPAPRSSHDFAPRSCQPQPLQARLVLVPSPQSCLTSLAVFLGRSASAYLSSPAAAAADPPALPVALSGSPELLGPSELLALQGCVACTLALLALLTDLLRWASRQGATPPPGVAERGAHSSHWPPKADQADQADQDYCRRLPRVQCRRSARQSLPAEDAAEVLRALRPPELLAALAAGFVDSGAASYGCRAAALQLLAEALALLQGCSDAGAPSVRAPPRSRMLSLIATTLPAG
jgi:hypothetical protein